MKPAHLFLLVWAALAGGLYLFASSAYDRNQQQNELEEAQRMHLPLETYRWAEANSDHAYTVCKAAVQRRNPRYEFFDHPSFTFGYMTDRTFTVIASDLISTNVIGLKERMVYSCDVRATGSDWSGWPVTIRAIERYDS